MTPIGALLSGSRVQVLIVDDEPSVCEVLKVVITDLGYAAHVAGTAAQALELVAMYHPDVVLLDLSLPDMTGDVLLERIREVDPRVRVVIVTGDTDANRAQGLLAHGAFAYVPKPFHLDGLARILEAAVIERG